MPDPGTAGTDPHSHTPDTELEISSAGVGLCFGCRALDHCQMGVRSERIDHDGVTHFEVVCPPERQGARGVAHGGWTTYVLDEALGKLIGLQGRFAVTHTLSVRFQRPVPIGELLTIAVREVSSEGDRLDVAGDLALASSGALLATADGRFVLRSAEHFERYRAWLGDQG